LWYKLQYKMSETDLIKGCLNEDRVAQKELYKTYASKMMVVCMRYAKDTMEAEDILQEGFIKVFDNIKYFKNMGSFEGWIRKIMANTALNRIRKNTIYFEEINDISIDVSVNDHLIEKFSEKDILSLICSMPQGYKQVFNMFAIEGFSHKEISEQLGFEEATSRSQFAKAKKYLQQKLTVLEKINL